MILLSSKKNDMTCVLSILLKKFTEVLTEVSPLIGDGDLHISQVRIALVRPLQALGPDSHNARGALRDRDSSGCEKSQVWHM